MVRAASHSESDQVDAALSLLRASGGRVTTARRMLLEILYESEGHRTAEDLAAEVHERAPDVHLSTIYRNLDELERIGVVAHAHLGHGPATYHLATASHGHLVCSRCGATVEVPAKVFAGLGRDVRKRFGFAIDPRHFAVLGICATCAEG
jgi:Fe2+ or Zn2+ uptake regulation protein